MKEEDDLLILNKTWSYLNRRDVSNDANVISCKWVYRILEHNEDESNRFKARQVFPAFEQTECGEPYAPVSKMATICMLFAFAAMHDWDICQMDIVTILLHPTIVEDIYMELPEGYSIPGDEDNSRNGNYVYKVNKAIYGLKQAPCTWYTDIDEFLTRGLSLWRSVYDANLYVMKDPFLLL